MTKKERAEHKRLRRLWVTGKASRKQIMRCMVLDRKAANADIAAPTHGDNKVHGIYSMSAYMDDITL